MTNQNANSIVIDAQATSITSINPTTAGFFVRPVRDATTGSNQMLMWNGNEIIKSTAATSAANKTFVIDHPTKPDHHLVHACLEGPEAGVYYRGTGVILLDYAEVVLPDYVDALARDFTVQLTPIGRPRPLGTGRVVGGKFTVYGSPGEFFWTVTGSRGTITVEPKRSVSKVHGQGPYRWIE
jgi:hypothetical protein